MCLRGPDKAKYKTFHLCFLSMHQVSLGDNILSEKPWECYLVTKLNSEVSLFQLIFVTTDRQVIGCIFGIVTNTFIVISTGMKWTRAKMTWFMILLVIIVLPVIPRPMMVVCVISQTNQMLMIHQCKLLII